MVSPRPLTVGVKENKQEELYAVSHSPDLGGGAAQRGHRV